MKKFAMTSLSVAGILLLIGGILAMISSVAGGYRFSVLAKEIELDDKIEYFIDDVGEVVYDSTHGRWGHLKEHDSHGSHYSGTISDIQEQINAGEVRKIKMEVGAGVFVLREKEDKDDKIDIAISGIGDCNYYMQGDTLHIIGFEGLKWADSASFNENRIEVWIPDGSSLNEVEIEIGAGTMNICDLRINKLKTEVGAGTLFLDNMEIDQLSVEVGAGKMEAFDTIATDAELSVAMGECTYNGDITGDLEAECAMGNMLFMLAGSETDHNYEIECDAGNIKVGSFSVTAFACEKTIHNHAASKYEINCGMGDVTVEFED